MTKQWQAQRKNTSNTSSPPVQKGVSWERPFSDPVYDAPAPQQTPSVQAKRPNFDWSRVTVEAQSPAGVQAKLVTQINAPQTQQPQQASKGLIQRVTTRDTEAKKRHREEQEALSQPRTDSRKRTRASQTASDSQQAQNLLPSIPNFKTDENGSSLWYMELTGPKRPSWGGVDEEIYESASKQYNPQKNRTEYLCEKTNKYLPRKKDRKGGEDYLDIDHKLNWKEHIYNSLDMHEVSVNYNEQIIQVRAYIWEEVETVYRDKGNLQLIAKSVNRSKSGPKHFDSAVQEYSNRQGG